MEEVDPVFLRALARTLPEAIDSDLDSDLVSSHDRDLEGFKTRSSNLMSQIAPSSSNSNNHERKKVKTVGEGGISVEPNYRVVLRMWRAGRR